MYNQQIVPLSRQKSLKHKKNKHLLRWLFLFFLLLAIIAYLKSPISRVTDIQITGLNLLEEQDIYQKAEIHHNMHYFLIKTSTIEEKLLELKEIKKVEVIKEFPGKCRITILENKPVAMVHQQNGNLVPLLENGYLMNNNKRFFNLPLITNWKDGTRLTALAEQLDKLHPVVLEEISEIQQDASVADQNQLLIMMRDGYKIHIFLDELSKKLNLYPSIIDSLKEKNQNTGELYLLESIRFEEYGKDDEGGHLDYQD